MRGEGLEVLIERLTTVNPDKTETYKFLGVEQSDRIKVKMFLNKSREKYKNGLILKTLRPELDD